MVNNTLEQQEAIETIECNVALSAGAGSGKTKVLADRFLYILKYGNAKTQNPSLSFLSAVNKIKLEADSILAITFTRKAAAEIKSRVQQRILDETKVLGESEERGSNVPKDQSLREAFWHKQLAALEHAQISTIHSLCSRILKENPVEAGLDPNFNIAEDFDKQEFIRKCLNDYLRSEIGKGNEDLQKLLAIYGFGSLYKQLEKLLFVYSAEDVDLATPYKGADLEERQLAYEMCNILKFLSLNRMWSRHRKNPRYSTKTDVILDKIIENIDKLFSDICSSPIDFTLYDELTRKLRAAGNLKEEIKKLKYNRERIPYLEANKAAEPLIAMWQKILKELTKYSTCRKNEQDFLTYDDLEVRALALLEKNEEVRHKYQRQFAYIMVDEFQDTNDRQRQLIYLLCGDDKEHLIGKKLFIVGDPKQSIYRFRGADVRVFKRVQRDISETGGKILSLKRNFRSTEKILSFTNSVFRSLMGEDCTKDFYFEKLEPAPSDIKGPKPLLIKIVLPKDIEKELDKRRIEAEVLAKEMLHLHNDEKIPYKDMVVLLREKTHFETLAECLRNKGVPVCVVDGKGFFDRQEVLDILNLFTVLHNPCRSIELAGVLRSPYFGLNDETLTRLFLMGGKCLWEDLRKTLLQDQGEASYKTEQWELLKRAFKILSDLCEYSAVAAVPEIWQRVWQDLHVAGCLALQKQGKAKLANVYKLRQLSLNCIAQKNTTLGEWLAYIEQFRKAELRETSANISNGGVEVMTIHAAKGLERKVVFLPMLDRNYKNSDKVDSKLMSYAFLDGEVPKTEIRFGIKAILPDGSLCDSAVLLDLKTQDKELEREERIRLFYVAMTRAKNFLILSGTVKDKENQSKSSDKNILGSNWLEQVNAFAGKETVESEEIKYEGISKGTFPLKLNSNENELKQASEFEKFISPLPAYVAQGRRYFSPSALQTYLYCERRYFYQQILHLPELTEATEGKIALPAHLVGSIIHRALELYKGNNADIVWEKAVQENAPKANTTTARRIFDKYIVSPLFKSLPEERDREIKFYLPLPDVDLVITGVIDCIYEKDDKLILVDYKTGMHHKSEKEGNKGYAYQLALYKEAAEKLLRKKVMKAELHFLQDLSKWELPEKEDYLLEAKSLCKEINCKTEEKDFACRKDCKNCPYAYICKKD